MNYSHILNELRAEADIEIRIGFLKVQTDKLHFDSEQVSHYNIEYFDDMNDAKRYNAVIVSSDMYLSNSASMKLAVKNGLILIVMFPGNVELNVDDKRIFNDFIYKVIPDDIEPVKLAGIFRKIEQSLIKDKERDLLFDKYDTALTNFNTMIDIGASLSEIRDIDRLFDQILTKSREITKADAGSIYLIIENKTTDEDGNEKTERLIKFEKSQNYSFDLKTPTFTMPITKKSIVGYAALTGVTENIPDAHHIPEDKDYSYSVESETKLKVRNKSVIVTPMINTDNEIIGVLQLFNKKRNFLVKIDDMERFEQQVIPFTKADEEIVTSFASQAGVTLENSLLYKEISGIFEGFIRASVTAIESRDPTTSGHSGRVALLTSEFARTLNNIHEGKYKDVTFSEDRIKYIEYAGLLHDFGKIGVRESVLVKADKLYPEQLENIKNRLDLIKHMMSDDANKRKIDIIEHQGYEEYLKHKDDIDKELADNLAETDRYIEAVLNANKPSLLEDDCCNIIKELENKQYKALNGDCVIYLTSAEVASLTVKRGSLTEEERKEIESHVTHSYDFLKKIPWTKAMSCIPDIAYAHHEKLNGRGYPRGLHEDEIMIESKMMAIADIFDALTASDRPYKKAAPLDKALQILGMEKDAGSLDSDLVDIFIGQKVYEVLNNK
ncbi:MAG: GAF domain-containing protein [Spirochaetales bacterium]|nr:GAF domain-containing protein [Spirochaetales bacterium]